MMTISARRTLQIASMMILSVLIFPIIDSRQTSTNLIIALNSKAQSVDYWPTDNWQLSTPEEQGMNSTMLDQMQQFASNWPIHSMLIIRKIPQKMIKKLIMLRYPELVIHFDSGFASII